MVINIGYIEGTANSGDVVVRVYYDTAWLDTDPTRAAGQAPLVNGPRGWCLDMTNVSGSRCNLTITSPSGNLSLAVAQGDPVTAGPASGRSRTAAQMASLGFTTRGSIGNFQIGDTGA